MRMLLFAHLVQFGMLAPFGNLPQGAAVRPDCVVEVLLSCHRQDDCFLKEFIPPSRQSVATPEAIACDKPSCNFQTEIELACHRQKDCLLKELVRPSRQSAATPEAIACDRPNCGFQTEIELACNKPNCDLTVG